MRAIQMTEFGGPEVLKAVELPVPQPGPDEVLIEVELAGLNFADTHTRTNSYVRKATLPLVPGGEVAGIRQDTGERVVALVDSGGYAEYATAPARLVFPIPDSLDGGTARALLIQGLTAWHLYRTAAHVAEGESVVVHSAAGGGAARPGRRAVARGGLCAPGQGGELRRRDRAADADEEAAQAHAALGARRTAGKLLLGLAASGLPVSCGRARAATRAGLGLAARAV